MKYVLVKVTGREAKIGNINIKESERERVKEIEKLDRRR